MNTSIGSLRKYILTHTYANSYKTYANSNKRIYARTHTHRGGSKIFVKGGGAIIYCKGREPKKRSFILNLIHLPTLNRLYNIL